MKNEIIDLFKKKGAKSVIQSMEIVSLLMEKNLEELQFLMNMSENEKIKKFIKEIMKHKINKL